MSSGSFLLPFLELFVSLVFLVSLSRGAAKAPAGANRRAESTRLMEDLRKGKRRIMTPLPRHVSNGAQQLRTELACTQYRTKFRLPGSYEAHRVLSSLTYARRDGFRR